MYIQYANDFQHFLLIFLKLALFIEPKCNWYVRTVTQNVSRNSNHKILVATRIMLCDCVYLVKMITSVREKPDALTKKGTMPRNCQKRDEGETYRGKRR